MTAASNVWTGKTDPYDRARPPPPAALLDLLTQAVATPYPALVVDLDSGTGLPNNVVQRRGLERFWAVFGVWPADEMLRGAEPAAGRRRSSPPTA